MDTLPYLERVKIQSEILLPLYRRLRDELGRERTNELLRESVTEYATQLGEATAATASGTSLEKLKTLMPAFAADDALDVEPLADNTEEFSINVKRCGYAEHFKSIGEPEFGAMVTCEIDPPMTSGIDQRLTLERSQTLMSQNKPCDFRWKLGGT